MPEIDLIPSEYRATHRRRRRMTIVVGLGAILLLVVVAARGALEWTIRNEQTRSADLEQHQTRLAAADSQIRSLEARRSRLQDRLRALDTVLRGPDLGASFLAVDRALQPEIRFLEMRFVRQGELVEAKARATNQGHFIVLPQDNAAGRSADAAWRLEQHLEIRGQAASHSILADFLGRLGAEPAMRQIRLLDTDLRAYTDTRVVDFRLVAQPADGRDARR